MENFKWSDKANRHRNRQAFTKKMRNPGGERSRKETTKKKNRHAPSEGVKPHIVGRPTLFVPGLYGMEHVGVLGEKTLESCQKTKIG